MATQIIETNALTVFYGRHLGIQTLDLAVEEGEIYGFLGPNGSGKSTTLRVLLDIIHPSSGSARLFGLDCQTDGVTIRHRVGYLPGELSLPSHLRGAEFLNLVSAMRGNKTDKKYRDELCERLKLDTSRQIQDYSRGNKQKVGLVAAFMDQPDLLILDEPTGGLDPLMQQTVLDLVRETQVGNRPRTVFFSSHILSEVEAVCDKVGIIRNGRLVTSGLVAELLAEKFRRLRLTLERPAPPDAFDLPGVKLLEHNGTTILMELQENWNQVLQASMAYGIIDLETLPITLEEIFMQYYTNGDSDV